MGQGIRYQVQQSNILFAPDRIDEMGQPGTFHSTVQDGPMLETRHGDSISTSTMKVASPAELFIGLKEFKGHHRAPTAHIIDILPTCLQLAGLEESGKLPFPDEVSSPTPSAKLPLALSTLNMKVIGPSGKVDGNSLQLQEKLGNSTTSAKTLNSRTLPSKNLNSSRNLRTTGRLGRVKTSPP